MTPLEYRTALATLGLSQLAAGRWLGVSNKTAQRYATTGPSGAAARAVGMAVALKGLERFENLSDGGMLPMGALDEGEWVRHDHLSSVIGLPSK